VKSACGRGKRRRCHCPLELIRASSNGKHSTRMRVANNSTNPLRHVQHFPQCQCLVRAWRRSAIYRSPRNWSGSSSPSRSHCKVNKPSTAPPNTTDGSRNRPQLQPRPSHSHDWDPSDCRAIWKALGGCVGGVQVLEAVLRGKCERVAVGLRSSRARRGSHARRHAAVSAVRGRDGGGCDGDRPDSNTAQTLVCTRGRRREHHYLRFTFAGTQHTTSAAFNNQGPEA
jgi:hypothetical protein